MTDTTDITISPDVPLFLLVNLVDHELRRQVIKYILDLDQTERFSPSAMSPRLGLSSSNVIYHFNILKRGGLVKLVDKEPARGATRHIYERDSLLNEHEALLVRLIEEATNEKRWLSRKPSLRS